MVLPLIPVALIAAGVITGGSGAALGGLGALDFKRAADRRRAAQEQYNERRSQVETRVVTSNGLLKAYGEQQQESLVSVVVRMRDFMLRHDKQVRESERLLVDGVDAESKQVPGLGRLDVDAMALVGAALGSAATSVGAGVGVGTLAGAVGSASTGTAISALSGVAAENALLAWLGGGSIASGGGGMALGGLALNFVTLGPALLVGGFVAKGQGARQVTKAKEDEAKLSVATEELGVTEAQLTAIDRRVDELSSVLGKITGRAVVALDVLESEPFELPKHAEHFQRAMRLVVAVRDIAAAPIIDDAGDLTKESVDLTVKYQLMADDRA